MGVINNFLKKIILFSVCIFSIESCYYDISMYKGDCCIKKIGYRRFSGFQIDFEKFIMDNTVKKEYEIDTLPPHGGYHGVDIIVHDLPDSLKSEILEVTPTIKLWTEEKNIFNVTAALSDFYVNKNLRKNLDKQYRENDKSIGFFFKNFKKTGKGPETIFTQDLLRGKKCYLSLV